LHHTGPVTSSINIRAARDIAVAEAEERRAAERAAAEKQAAERRAQQAADARRRAASILSSATGAQRSVGGNRKNSQAAPQTQSSPMVRKTRSINIGEFHGKISKRKKKPDQQITKPTTNSAELDQTVLMDTNDVQAAAQRYAKQHKSQQQTPRVENTAARTNSPRPKTARIPITQRSTASRSQAPGAAAAQNKRPKSGTAPQRSAQARTASAKTTGAKKVRPKNSIAKNPAARNAALKNTVRTNLARQANEQMAQRQQSPSSAQQNQSQHTQQRAQAHQPQRRTHQQPRPAEVASRSSVQSKPVQSHLAQSDPGYSPAKIVAAAQARARQDAQTHKKPETPQQQTQQRSTATASTAATHNPWNSIPTPQKKSAAANPWNSIPATSKQTPEDIPTRQKQSEPSISEKLANKPEFAGFDMEKLLQPGYKPQTRKEAIAIRRAQEELNLNSGENQRSQTEDTQRQEDEAARRERERAEVHRQRLEARRRREEQAQRTRAEESNAGQQNEQTQSEREQREQNQAQLVRKLAQRDNARPTSNENTRTEPSRPAHQTLKVRDGVNNTLSTSAQDAQDTDTQGGTQPAAQSTGFRSAPAQASVHPTASVRPVKRAASHASPFKLAPGEVRSGVVRRRRLAPRLQGPMEAVFVCTGNVARSAAAEIIASQLSEEYGLTDDWIFTSAGTSALSGSRVYRHVGKQLDERGYDISGYRAKQLTEDMVERATLILVAEAEHADWIIREWPQYHHKVHLIKQVANLKQEIGSEAEPISYLYSHNQAPRSSDNIGDPYRQGKEAARIAVDEIENSLFEILPWLSQAQVQS
jgi:protein-tyrosine-phosphatase